ncbi:MAG: LytTR family DNA-binding domain-containing protein [Oceanospirillaceae bacterium]
MTRAIEVLIIEDEPRAANRLERMLKAINAEVVVCDKLPSIEKACLYLSSAPAPDLIFLDIQLEDGECFEIFEKVSVTSPIIFCTAYSEYALQAFKVNSIDYLLKPINQQELSRALNKYQQLLGYRMPVDWPLFLGDENLKNTKKPPYRKRFLVTSRKQFIPIQVQDVNVIAAFMKGIKLITAQQQEWLLDDSLLDIEGTLNPNDFIRVSRQSIVRINAIKAFDLNKLEVSIAQVSTGQATSLITLAVSRSRIAELKEALSR